MTRKVPMDELARIRTFIKVVDAGSFSAAARDTSSASSVSRQVQSLEDELGVRLLNRNSRGLSLTDAGRRFYQRVTTIANDLGSAMSEAKSLQDDVRGILRVSLRMTAGITVVAPALPEFLAQHPELRLEISLTDERVDLIANGIDVAVWLGELPDADIVARRLSASRRVVCGSPAYFAQRGIPQTPQDLRDHSCLVFAASPSRHRWSFSRDGKQEDVDVSGPIETDNGLMLLSAGLAGLGVIIVQEWMVSQLLAQGRIERVLNDYIVRPRPGDAELHAIFPSSRKLSRKVRAFVDFLVEAFSTEEAGRR